MDKRQSIQALQSRLAARLAEKSDSSTVASWLAVELCQQRFLMPLKDAGELFSVTRFTNVPHAKKWFLGLANLRGALYGVIDLAGFLGLPGAAGRAWTPGPEGRLVGLPDLSDTNCALAVDKLLGLRSHQDFTKVSDATIGASSLSGAVFRDQDGHSWHEIDLVKLSQLADFLDIHERPLSVV